MNGNGNAQSKNKTNRTNANASPKQSQSRRNTSVLSLLGSLLRLLIFDIPLSALFILLVSSLVIRHTYHAYITTYIDAYRRSEPNEETGFYPDFEYDMTYYNRQCDKYDITTRDANDLYIDPSTATHEKAASTMMRHGAVVVPGVLQPTTATELRQYLESRHKIQAELPWHEKFFEEEDRLALGLGAGDHPVVTEALRQVGTNPTVRTTVEGILGPDPAVVEISTITSLAGADDQGIHTDSDYFGSSLLYSRTFLHSYTMFISLQNTTARMGATTLCPGTHHCANPDMEEICLTNGAFEASSNGLTGPDNNDGKGGGVLLQGDAMMFNQNVWHRGAANQDPMNPNTNRVMFILTFVSRNKAHAADRRYQGLGTYYYQRWNTWGHTYQDLKDAGTVMRQPLAAMRSMGIWKPRGRNWGVTWIEHMARELANAEHFYASHELKTFAQYLDKVGVPKFLQGEYGRRRKKSLRKWQPFVEEMMDKIVRMLALINALAVGLYVIVRFVGLALGGLVALVTPSSSSSESSKPQRGILGGLISASLPIIGAFAAFAFVIGIIFPEQSQAFAEPITKCRISADLEIMLEDLFWNPSVYLLPVAAVVATLIFGRIIFISAQRFARGKASMSPLPSFVGRLILSHGFVAILALGSIRQYGQTNLAKKAASKDIFTRPFAPVRSSIEHDGPTAFPERMDILIGTRLDADWLASFNDMFDYHPGNIRFNNMISSFATLPSSLVAGAPLSILDLLEKKIEGIVPRFLHQGYADGYWTVMPTSDAMDVIRLALEMERDGLKETLGKTIKSILADSRFGTLRDTAMAKTFAPKFAERWEDAVFGAATKDDVNKSSIRLGALDKREKPMFQPRKFAVASLLRSGDEKFDAQPSTDALRVGDKVLLSIEKQQWEEARIEFVRNAKMCDVRTLSGKMFMNIYSEELREYESFAEGDRVVAYFASTDSWHKGFISKVHPLGTYEVDFDDGDKEYELERKLLRKPKTMVKPVFLHFDPSTLPTYKVGDPVWANFEGQGDIYPAEISVFVKMANATYSTLTDRATKSTASTVK